MKSFVLCLAVIARGSLASQCVDGGLGARALVQLKADSFGVDCEGMCKKVGAYPNCQCPGFEGNPSSDDDTRRCMEQYCQDPKTPCPTDNFVACVKQNTEVSALQWGSVISRVDHTLDSLLQT